LPGFRAASPPSAGQARSLHAHKKAPRVRGFLWSATASGHLDDGLHDGALGGDGLGVRLIVALGLDQVHQLIGQVDVGVLQGVGHDRTQGTGLRAVKAWLARGESLSPGGAAGWLQALFVVEAGQRDLADGLALLVAERGEQHAAAVDFQASDLAGGVAIGDRRVTVAGRVVLGDVAHIDGNPVFVGISAIARPDAVDHATRLPIVNGHRCTGDVGTHDFGELAGTIKGQGGRHRHRMVARIGAADRRAVRVTTVNQRVGIPGIGTRLDHVLHHRVGIALGVVERGGVLSVETVGLGWVKRVQCLIDRQVRGVQVTGGIHLGGCLRRQVRQVQLQVDQAALDDFTVLVCCITLQARSTGVVGDVAVFVGTESQDLKEGQRSTRVQSLHRLGRKTRHVYFT
jgi:hypothetical protein